MSITTASADRHHVAYAVDIFGEVLYVETAVPFKFPAYDRYRCPPIIYPCCLAASGQQEAYKALSLARSVWKVRLMDQQLNVATVTEEPHLFRSRSLYSELRSNSGVRVVSLGPESVLRARWWRRRLGRARSGR